MIKSVWLINNIVDSLQKKDNILFSSYSLSAEYFQAKNGRICLFEPDGSIGEVIRISPKSVRKEPAFYYVYPSREQLKPDAFLQTENGLHIPLYTENTSVFGFLSFNDSKISKSEMQMTDKALEIIRSFGSVVYSEALGSIVSSFHENELTVKDLCVDYKTGSRISHVVKGVSFGICKDELMVVLGASGCGKTSMLNAIGGMLTPSQGSVLWNGNDVAKMSDKQKTEYRRNTVGFIFQQYNLIPTLNAVENVNVAAAMVKDPLSLKEVFEMVGLSDKMNSYPGQLSGGEQQRVCIARALVKKAKLLLCDEPTGALDSKNAENIMRIPQHIAKEHHIPVVVITHNPQLSVLADHYLFMSNGKIENEFYQPFPISADNLTLK